MALLLGVDIGTTGTKTILIDDNGKIISSAYKGYKLYKEKISFVEQSPEDWWDAVVQTVSECTRDVRDKNEIKAMSLSTQGGSLVPVDRDGVPLMRAISWMDTRASEQGMRMRTGRGEDYFYLKTGWRLESGLNLAQIGWLKDNEPDLLQKTFKFLSTVEFINFKLTGRFCGDPSNAGITLLMNIRGKTWDRDILDILGVDLERLGDVAESGDVVGTLTDAAAKQLGLPKSLKVISGGHDQYCVALGAGAINDGDMMLSTGTAWVVLGISDKPVFDTVSHFSPGNHVVNGKWGILSSLPTGGAALEWFAENIGNNESLKSVDEQASQKPAGSDGVMVFPHFSGSADPNPDPRSRACILGLDLSHDRYHIARAFMEGIAYEINRMIEDLFKKGMKTSKLKVLGGATKSSLWMQILSDITGLPVLIPESSDVACVGAAVLAGAGAGLFKDLQEGHARLARNVKEISPDTENNGLYKQFFSRYMEISEVLKKGR